MVVHAYDLFFYLSSWSTVSYLWSDQRRYVLALVAALPGGAGRLARLAPRQHARRAPPGRRCAGRVRALAWYGAYSQGRAAPYAVLLLEPVCLVVLCVLGRDPRDAVAGRPARGGAARRRGCRPSPFPRAATCGAPAAHHPDPPGIGGAAVAVPDAALRPFGRSVLPLRRPEPAPAAGRDLRRRVVADRVLAARRRLDPLVRRHAPVRADLHAEQAEGHAAAGAGALRLSQRRVLPDAEELRVQRPVLQFDRLDARSST